MSILTLVMKNDTHSVQAVVSVDENQFVSTIPLDPKICALAHVLRGIVHDDIWFYNNDSDNEKSLKTILHKRLRHLENLQTTTWAFLPDAVKSLNTGNLWNKVAQEEARLIVDFTDNTATLNGHVDSLENWKHRIACELLSTLDNTLHMDVRHILFGREHKDNNPYKRLERAACALQLGVLETCQDARQDNIQHLLATVIGTLCGNTGVFTCPPNGNRVDNAAGNGHKAITLLKKAGLLTRNWPIDPSYTFVSSNEAFPQTPEEHLFHRIGQRLGETLNDMFSQDKTLAHPETLLLVLCEHLKDGTAWDSLERTLLQTQKRPLRVTLSERRTPENAHERLRVARWTSPLTTVLNEINPHVVFSF